MCIPNGKTLDLMFTPLPTGQVGVFRLLTINFKP